MSSVVYLSRHQACPLYIGNTPLGFGLFDVEAGFTGHFNPHLATFLFILEGSLTILRANSKSVVLQANEMFVIPIGEVHEVRADERCRAVRLYMIGDSLEFCHCLVPEDIVRRHDRRSKTPQLLPMVPALRQFVELLVTYIGDGMLCCDIHRLKQRELAALLQCYYKKKPLGLFLAPLYQQHSTFMSKVVEMAASFLTADEMAERLAMPRAEFVHLFALHFKEPHGKWLLRNKARALYRVLQAADIPLADVAVQLRFSSQQHMNTFCRTNLGCTPRQVQEGSVPEAIKAQLLADVSEQL